MREARGGHSVRERRREERTDAEAAPRQPERVEVERREGVHLYGNVGNVGCEIWGHVTRSSDAKEYTRMRLCTPGGIRSW